MIKHIRDVLLEMDDMQLISNYWPELILKKIEDKGMAPPGYMKPIPFESDGQQYPLVPGDFKNDLNIWCTPGQQEWEPENE